jgi:uncharacterized protein YjbI with pentapeptide repeats
MKLKHLVIVTVLGMFVIPAFHYSSRHSAQRHLVQQLLDSKECVGCDLRGADLAGLDLRGVNLKAADLTGVNLEGTKLENAILINADLSQANLTNADLGCATVNFNLRADQEAANVDLTVDSASLDTVQRREHILNFDFDADRQGATMSFNFGGCTNLQGATLTGARLPDGSIFQ